MIMFDQNRHPKLFLLLLFLPAIILFSGCVADSVQPSSTAASPVVSSTATIPLTYDDYAKILTQYVNEQGLVNYESLQANRQPLDRFTTALAQVAPSTYDAWDKHEKMAFWINAYNAFTLQSIIDQKPLKASIRDISGVWNRRKFAIAGQSKTLDNIEHDILRKEFKDPRIHMTLVCAAKSCPPLRQEPYVATKLLKQLDDQSHRFLASPHGLKIDPTAGKVYLSRIFDWYGDDWKTQYGIENTFAGNAKEQSVLHFISSYISPTDVPHLKAGKSQIQYLDYDWALNRQWRSEI